MPYFFYIFLSILKANHKNLIATTILFQIFPVTKTTTHIILRYLVD